MVQKSRRSRPPNKSRDLRSPQRAAGQGRSNAAMVTALSFIEVPPTRDKETLASAVLAGLSKTHKSLPSRFFYDTAGSQLFERITRLPEYYLTRGETDILRRHASEIVEEAGQNLQIVEFGSGNSEKTRLLLKAALKGHRHLDYVPIDISADFLRTSAFELVDDLPGLDLTALAGDYFDALQALPKHSGSRLFLFLGSTIGNFDREEAIEFLIALRKVMRYQDRLLVGVDLKKHPEIVELAYNDAENVTAAFNKNLLARINRQLCGHFDLASFRHEAIWNEQDSRIEMHLTSLVEQDVSIEALGRSFHFERGESIHTENSHKYSPEAFGALAEAGGLRIQRCWEDTKGWFTLNLLEPAG